MGILLGKSLIYAAVQEYCTLEPSVVLLPMELRNRILSSIRFAGGYACTADITQPIKRVAIVVHDMSGKLHFADVGGDSGPRDSAEATNVAILREMKALGSVVLSIQRRMEGISSNRQIEQQETRSQMQRNMNRLHATVQRIASQPAARLAAPERAVTTRKAAQLSKRPADLFLLWKEYEFGLGGKKPARQFTPTERGACKWAYSFRMGFWRAVENLMNRGHTSDTAIDTLYSAYGRSKSVTMILRALRADKGRRLVD